ncbi:MAG: hypothetical protein JXR73_21850 [Candidatus Omnitrophica bacterium]|nr:hypothetical protein [Candidatus Omnitrophota bacterium]
MNARPLILRSLGIVFTLGLILSGAAEERASERSKALLQKVNEQYQRDLQKAERKHAADVIMGERWGEMNAKDEIRFQLVRVYVEQEKFEEAQKLLQSIIAQSPDVKAKMRAWCTLGAIAEIGLEKPHEALKAYREAIQTPGNRYVNITGGAYLAMAEIYLQLNDRRRAKLILEESYRSLTYTRFTPVPIADELREQEP